MRRAVRVIDPVQCKAPGTLELVSQLNCGLFFGYSQIGKVVTVYPRSVAEAMTLAEALREATADVPGPDVPFDNYFGGRVFYRWGSFSLHLREGDGEVPAIRGPDGKPTPDVKAPGRAVPPFIGDPFAARAAPSTPPSALRLLRAYECLSQRGKGGVYRALDLSVVPARVCVLKEGRRHGETEWDGTDGFERLERERTALVRLEAAGLGVPRVLDSLAVDGRRYLALEHIAGRTLAEEAATWAPHAREEASCRAGRELAKHLSAIHGCGLAWRDLKPTNVVVSEVTGALVPLDFEGACERDDASAPPWGTAAYLPPRDPPGHWAAQDVYALGLTVARMLQPEVEPPRLPEPLAPLLAADPLRRPSAEDAVELLLTWKEEPRVAAP
ncbi:MAG: hypothetical protein IT380_11775 [Myxococcales bacterium]|nr:hypothetical protein [Myxococcales bacterium]